MESTQKIAYDNMFLLLRSCRLRKCNGEWINVVAIGPKSVQQNRSYKSSAPHVRQMFGSTTRWCSAMKRRTAGDRVRSPHLYLRDRRSNLNFTMEWRSRLSAVQSQELPSLFVLTSMNHLGLMRLKSRRILLRSACFESYTTGPCASRMKTTQCQ